MVSLSLQLAQEQGIPKKLKFLYISVLWGLSLNYQYTIYQKVLQFTQNTNYQPIAALVLVLIRELALWVNSKLIHKSANGDEQSAQLITGYSIAGRHGIQICTTVGGIASPNTVYVLLGIDFSINVYLAVKIVWLRKRRSDQIDKQIDLLQELALNELIEFVLPLAYIGAQILGYYGPNAENLVDVGADIWTSAPIKNLWDTTSTVLWFFACDFGSTVLTGILLWSFCKINLLQAFATLDKEFYLAFLLVPSFWTSSVNFITSYV